MIKPLGAVIQPNNVCRFTVWAPEKNTMLLHIVSPEEQMIAMHKNSMGYFTIELPGILPGSRYYYRPDDSEKDYPDPASFYQPEGVHGPSEVVDLHYPWTDTQWRNMPLKEYILYEIHIGTFTPAGTFEAVIPYLDELAATGITVIEIMPVNQFPGKRNWGYDGVLPYATQNSYGGYRGLQKLVDACHQKGIAVVLDVIYNHMGPEGNYLHAIGPYFNHKYSTPWGDALNYDGSWCDGVRNYFCYNALYWFTHFHIDGLRLDAIHEIYDFSAVHFFELLHAEVKALEETAGQRHYLFAESDLNTPRIVQHPEAGGFGFDVQWLDDFHHSLYVLLDEKGKERYADFGRIEQLTKAYTDGFVHSGDYVQFRHKQYGRSSAGIAGNQFLVFNQNHDQIGNRSDSARLSMLISFPLLKVAAAALLLSPYIPMLFMGEEYGEDTPFSFFIDHRDQVLKDKVREGRKKEFEKFPGHDDFIDPASDEAFNGSKIQWQKRHEGKYKTMLAWYQALIQLRKTNRVFHNFNKNHIRANILNAKSFTLYRKSEDEMEEALIIYNLDEISLTYTLLPYINHWNKILDAGDFTAAGEPVALFPQTIHAGEVITVPASSVAVYINHH